MLSRRYWEDPSKAVVKGYRKTLLAKVVSMSTVDRRGYSTAEQLVLPGMERFLLWEDRLLNMIEGFTEVS